MGGRASASSSSSTPPPLPPPLPQHGPLPAGCTGQVRGSLGRGAVERPPRERRPLPAPAAPEPHGSAGPSRALLGAEPRGRSGPVGQDARSRARRLPRRGAAQPAPKQRAAPGAPQTGSAPRRNAPHRSRPRTTGIRRPDPARPAHLAPLPARALPPAPLLPEQKASGAPPLPAPPRPALPASHWFCWPSVLTAAGRAPPPPRVYPFAIGGDAAAPRAPGGDWAAGRGGGGAREGGEGRARTKGHLGDVRGRSGSTAVFRPERSRAGWAQGGSGAARGTRGSFRPERSRRAERSPGDSAPGGGAADRSGEALQAARGGEPPAAPVPSLPRGRRRDSASRFQSSQPSPGAERGRVLPAPRRPQGGKERGVCSPVAHRSAWGPRTDRHPLPQSFNVSPALQGYAALLRALPRSHGQRQPSKDRSGFY